MSAAFRTYKEKELGGTDAITYASSLLRMGQGRPLTDDLQLECMAIILRRRISTLSADSATQSHGRSVPEWFAPTCNYRPITIFHTPADPALPTVGHFQPVPLKSPVTSSLATAEPLTSEGPYGPPPLPHAPPPPPNPQQGRRRVAAPPPPAQGRLQSFIKPSDPIPTGRALLQAAFQAMAQYPEATQEQKEAFLIRFLTVKEEERKRGKSSAAASRAELPGEEGRIPLSTAEKIARGMEASRLKSEETMQVERATRELESGTVTM